MQLRLPAACDDEARAYIMSGAFVIHSLFLGHSLKLGGKMKRSLAVYAIRGR